MGRREKFSFSDNRITKLKYSVRSKTGFFENSAKDKDLGVTQRMKNG